jgi:hypothetical protein
MGLSLTGLLVACSLSVSPSATSAPATTPSSIPTATADATPTPSLVVTPSTTPVAASAAGCPTDPKPSTLATLAIASRLACYGSTTLSFPAVVVPLNGVVDWIPVQVPTRFRQASPPEHGPLFLVDWGADFDAETSLALYVADPSLGIPVNFRGNWPEGGGPTPSEIPMGGAVVTGHFDDPASADCRRPAGNEWPEITDEQVIQWCRGAFIVTGWLTGS